MHAALEGSSALVTGGAGAIGSHLVAQLLDEGATVDVVDDLSSGSLDNLTQSDGLRVHRVSILDAAFMARLFDHRRFDFVFHLAALFANQNSIDQPEKDLLTNALGTLRLLEMVKRHPIRRFVYASSSCVYGDRSDAAEAFTRLDTPYAISKLSGEAYTHCYHRTAGVLTTVVRFFNSYGPHDRPGRYRSVIPNFLQRARSGLPLVITGSGTETRDFTYVGDIVDGTILAAVCDASVGGVFDLGTGVETSIQRLAEEINAITGNPGGIAYVERRPWDGVWHRRADIAPASRVFGFRPKTAVREGLEKTWAWLRTLPIAEV